MHPTRAFGRTLSREYVEMPAGRVFAGILTFCILMRRRKASSGFFPIGKSTISLLEKPCVYAGGVVPQGPSKTWVFEGIETGLKKRTKSAAADGKTFAVSAAN